MNIRKEWMTDNQYFGEDYPNNVLLEQAKERFEIQKKSLEGKDALIDKTAERVVAQNHTNPLNQEKYDKKIHCNMDSLVHTGSVVEMENKVWLVISKIFDTQAYKTASLKECNNTLKFYQNKTYRTLPCYLTSGSVNYLELKESKYFITSDGRYLCICPDLGYIKKSDTHLRFLLNGAAYKVNGIDNITNSNGVNGLILMELADDVITDDDNLDEGIANWGSNQSVSEIQVLNGSYAELSYQNATLQLQVQCKFNGVIVENPEVIYASDNEYVATVNSDGLITCHGTGQAVITATFNNTFTTITIKGDMVIDNNYSIEYVNPATSIKSGKEVLFNVKILNNGIEVDKPIIWQIYNEDSSSNVYGQIINSTNTSCTIKATSTSSYVGKYFYLKCIYAQDTSIFAEQKIKVISLY